jgi:hypothetical protein
MGPLTGASCSAACGLANRGPVASSSGRSPPPLVARLRAVAVRASGSKVAINKAPPSPVTLTDTALAHLNKMVAEKGENLVLRIGVKSGGCRRVAWVRRAPAPRRPAPTFSPHSLPPPSPPPLEPQRHVLLHGLCHRPRRPQA